KLKVFVNRDVFVFPDLSKDGSTFKEWKTKAKDFENRIPDTRFIFSDLLERLATEKDRQQGNDIADILIKHDWRNFREKEPQPEKEPQTEPLPQWYVNSLGVLERHQAGKISDN